MGLSLPLGNPLIKSVKPGIKRAHVEGKLESEKAIDLGYAGEHAGERPILGGGGKGGIDTLSVALSLHVTGIGVDRGGEGGLP